MSDDLQGRNFEKRWQHRFTEFAANSDNDAGIAGWSETGLQTRFRFFTSQWRGAAPNATYLDAGCGAGTYSRWLSNLGLKVIGLDYSLTSLAKAKQRESKDIAYCVADASRLPFPDHSADGILCFGVLQAVWASGPLIAEAARVLRPGGELWIDALNACGLRALWDRTSRKLRGKPMHLRYESPYKLAELMRQNGFGEVARFWLPIMPVRLQRLQPVFEAKRVQATLDTIGLFGAVVSHSVLIRGVLKK